MIDKTLAELKSIAAELGITPEGDKRLKDTWIRAIHARGITVVDPWYDTDKTPLENNRKKLPLGARVALMCEPKSEQKTEEIFVPKFHEISNSGTLPNGCVLRYRYANDGIYSDWIRYDGPIEELRATLKEIEEGMQGIIKYREYKIQVSPLAELFYKIPNGTQWFKFPLNEDEDIQEGIPRLKNWIDSLIELWGEANLPTIPQNNLIEFRRNCAPVATAPRPP